MKYTFSDPEKDQIKDAVAELEKVSCGEIVPYFANTSDNYSEASWYTSAIFGLLSTLLISILSYNWLLPFKMTPFEVSILIFSSLAVGFFLPVLFPSLKRWIIPDSVRTERVRQKANEAFLSEGVFETEERVGILIFVSYLEHKVLVLGDQGINQKVKSEDWQQVVQTIVQGIKDKQLSQGIVNAIDQCKDLLLSHGFVRKATDFNELGNDLRIED